MFPCNTNFVKSGTTLDFKMHEVGDINITGLHRDSKNKFKTKILPSISVWCSPVWASWEIFNLTFVSAPIDFWILKI